MALDLITLAEYKAYIGISSTSQDSIITRLIPQVSALVKQICNRTFLDYVDELKVETFKGGTHHNRILLSETPLMRVASVQFSNDFGKTYTALVEYEDYVTIDTIGAVELIASQYIDYHKTNAFRVSYYAGYETLPPDLKLAVGDLIQYYIRNDAAVHSQKGIGANNIQIEYITNTNMPAHIRRILDQYSAYYG